MDFILKKLNNKIVVFESIGDKNEQSTYLRVKIEYCLVLMFSYLWNKHFESLEYEDRTFVLDNYKKPSIGTIIHLIRKLDRSKEIFLNKPFKKSIDEYPEFRNDILGHGFLFNDGQSNSVKKYNEIIEGIFQNSIFLNENMDMVIVTNKTENLYKGINFKYTGEGPIPWACQGNKYPFEINNTYLLRNDNEYYRLSPFLHLLVTEEFLTYRSLEEPLTGRIKYNHIFRTNSSCIEWPELVSLHIINDGKKIKSTNGTIVNIFKNNYSNYIETDVKKQIKNFLTDSNSSVCATVWGHGGVGKTASVQCVCEELLRNKRYFDYIVFVSAKDRYYDYLSGTVEEIEQDERTESFENIIRVCNSIIFDEESTDPSLLISSDSKFLLVIDDYETFATQEKEKIETFIDRLDIRKHKVIITTRANIKIGNEITTNELNESDTVAFIKAYIEEEFGSTCYNEILKNLQSTEVSKKIFTITSGRPIFIIQLANIIMQRGSLVDALSNDIKSSHSAIDFLYGRIFDYLSKDAKDAFVAISRLVSEADLSNLLSKLKYILNLEDVQTRFDSAIKELIKLKIIEVYENQFFRVYSPEILHKMTEYFQRLSEGRQRGILSRLKLVSKDKELQVDVSLLNAANISKLTASEGEVISSFRQIINRPTATSSVKRDAIISLSEYLYSFKGKKIDALKVLSEHSEHFLDDPKYLQFFSIYSWAVGQHKEAITILLTFFKAYRDLHNESYLNLFGLLLGFRCLAAIEDRETLKEKLRFQEISKDDYSKASTDQKSIFIDIFDHQGIPLYQFVNYNVDQSKLNAKTKQNILNGLNHFAEVCIRLQRFSTAKDICIFVLDKFPRNFHDPFIARKRRVDKYEE